tara:strand:- start:1842 stop:2102 length:261 start_codon:yes stop_codon:yes gene_type:complete
MVVLKNAQKFLALEPLEYMRFINQRGQTVRLLEHPLRGCDAPIYGEINGVVFDTEFYDHEDMTDPNSEYAPILLEDGTVYCYFEIC